MIRRSPCEYYIKYLLIHPDAYSIDDIHQALREQQLDFPGEVSIQRMKNRLRPPPVFRPYDPRHQPTFRFLVQEGVYYLFHPDQHMRAAIYLLGRPRAKEMIEAMSISNDPIDLICHRLGKIGIQATPLDLKRFFCFFWNMDLVDRTELNALLRMRVETMVADGDDPVSRARHRAMKAAYYNDTRMAAVASPVSPFAGVLNQMRYGFRPDRVDIVALLETAKEIATIRTAEELLGRGPNAAQTSRDFSAALQNLHSLTESVGSLDADLQNNVMNLMLDTDGEEVPYIQQLTGGDHTVDVQPTDKHIIE